MKLRLLASRDTATGTGLGECQQKLASNGLFWENPSTKILFGVILQDNLKQSHPPSELGNYHRIIEWFGLEGTFKGVLVQPPCNKQGHLPPDQVAQTLECFLARGIYHLSGQPGPVFHHHHGKKYLPYIQSKSTLP